MKTRFLSGLILAVLIFAGVQVTSAAPIPTVTLNVPPEVQIGETFTFTATFQNTHPADVGYGPFVDLVFPFNGADGTAGTAMPDGVDFVRAEYLGTPVTATVLTFPAGPGGSGCVNHPYLRDATLRPVPFCGVSGDKLVVLELPFGSFTPNQPPADLTVTALLSPLADVNVPLTIQARGGFRFGANPVDDPCCDPAINSDLTSAPLTPILLTLEKENNAPENEIAIGPNAVYTWTVTVDLPVGQTITNLDITDYLPNNVVIDTSSVTTVPAGGTVTKSPPGGGPANPPDNELVITFPSVTGTSGTSDIVITFDFYVPYLDANGIPVLDPTTGNDGVALNNAKAVGDWTPNDPRDAGGVDNADVNGLCPTVCPGGNAPVLMSIAGQKSGLTVPAGQPLIPGTAIEYTITFQVSDFYAFGDVVITDTLSDGLRFDATFTPVLSFTGAMTNFSQTPGTNGTTILEFRITDELGGPLLGGCIPPGGTGGPPPNCTFNNGATSGSLRYRAIVQDQFATVFPSGDPSVDHGDLLTNEMNIRGQIRDVGNVTTALGTDEDDGSDDEGTVVRGRPTKSIYALNGVPCGACTGIRLAPGDTLTYRIQHDMPSSDFEDFSLVEYLPLPAFSAAEVTTLDPSLNNAVPPAGVAKLLVPGDTLHLVTGSLPTLAADLVSNAVVFNYGDFDTPTNQPSMIDLLFTVTMRSEPIADGLFLTNLVRAIEGSTNNASDQSDAIIQVEVTNPLLTMSKGVVSSSSGGVIYNPPQTGPVTFSPPGSSSSFNGVINSIGLDAQPVNSDLSGAQPGDILTFGIVIENLGSSIKGAFDIRIHDILPPGFSIPPGGLNLQVRLGNGTTVSYTGLGPSGSATDLFGAGLELIDPNLDTGVCGPYHGVDGTNIIVITYDLRLDTIPQNVAQNTATITTYSSEEGGSDHTGGQDITDSATITFGMGGETTGTGTSTTTTGIEFTKVVDSPFPLPGETIIWTITARNTSAAAVANVSITDTIPSMVEVQQVTASRGSVTRSGNTYTLALDILQPGETVTITIAARLPGDLVPPYLITNSATLLSGGTSLGSADSTIISAQRLAETGESPYDGMVVVLGVMLISGGVLALSGIALWRRKRPNRLV